MATIGYYSNRPSIGNLPAMQAVADRTSDIMSGLNRTNMRADRTEIVDIKNPYVDLGYHKESGPRFFEGDGNRLRKEIERTTNKCPECGADGRIDESGQPVCEDDSCAVVLCDDGDRMMYPEDGFAGTHNGGASGGKFQKTPALRAPGPNQGGNDAL